VKPEGQVAGNLSENEKGSRVNRPASEDLICFALLFFSPSSWLSRAYPGNCVEQLYRGHAKKV
jgi:hypothetical protein